MSAKPRANDGDGQQEPGASLALGCDTVGHESGYGLGCDGLKAGVSCNDGGKFTGNLRCRNRMLRGHQIAVDFDMRLECRSLHEMAVGKVLRPFLDVIRLEFDAACMFGQAVFLG